MKIVVAGGVVRPQSFELVGPLGGALLREVTLDVALLGVDAIDVQLGAAAHHEGEAAMNALMVARAKRVVIIADSSKLGGHAFARICPIERVETLVTDSGCRTRAVVDAFRDGRACSVVSGLTATAEIEVPTPYGVRDTYLTSVEAAR